MKFFEIILEIIGWFQIAIGTTLGAGIIAGIVYINWNNESGKLIAIKILSIGFLFGAVCATKIWKKHGTVNWLSRIRRIS